eukprot:COSAG05_NODE_4744_length_1388_cov_2.413499_1_plen_50_part_01
MRVSVLATERAFSVQQPARAGGRLPGRLSGRQPARAHASNEIPCVHPVRS